MARTEDITSPDNTTTLAADPNNPMLRDTIEIPSGGSVTIRWIADNPGAWILHCHIDFHLAVGLAMVVIEAPEKIQENLKVPDYMFQQCRQQGLPYTGNAGGLESLTNFGALPEGPTPLTPGWTGYSTGTFIACAFTALFGCGTVFWYSSHYSNDDEDEEDKE